jgi:hypothetical protein
LLYPLFLLVISWSTTSFSYVCCIFRGNHNPIFSPLNSTLFSCNMLRYHFISEKRKTVQSIKLHLLQSSPLLQL